MDDPRPFTAQINFNIDVFPEDIDGSLDTSGKLTQAELAELGITNKCIFVVRGFTKEDCVNNLKKALECIKYE